MVPINPGAMEKKAGKIDCSAAGSAHVRAAMQLGGSSILQIPIARGAVQMKRQACLRLASSTALSMSPSASPARFAAWNAWPAAAPAALPAMKVTPDWTSSFRGFSEKATLPTRNAACVTFAVNATPATTGLTVTSVAVPVTKKTLPAIDSPVLKKE